MMSVAPPLVFMKYNTARREILWNAFSNLEYITSWSSRTACQQRSHQAHPPANSTTSAKIARPLQKVLINELFKNGWGLFESNGLRFILRFIRKPIIMSFRNKGAFIQQRLRAHSNQQRPKAHYNQPHLSDRLRTVSGIIEKLTEAVRQEL